MCEEVPAHRLKSKAGPTPHCAQASRQTPRGLVDNKVACRVIVTCDQDPMHNKVEKGLKPVVST